MHVPSNPLEITRLPPYTPIRFGLSVGPLHVRGPDGMIPTHALVGYKYLEKLLTIPQLPIRLLPFAGMPYGFLATNPDWTKVSDAFMNDTILGNEYVNVICGWGSVFQPSLTQGVYNVAITVAWPRPPKPLECESLSKYDWICCPNMSDVKALRDLDLPAMYLPINEEKLAYFFKEHYLTKEKSYV